MLQHLPLVPLSLLALAPLARGQSFGQQNVLSTSADGARSVYAADIDGDGDLDVLSGSLLDDKVAWFENLGGGAFSSEHVITTLADGLTSIYAADLDGDGDVDVLSTSFQDSTIAWYENLGGGIFGPKKWIGLADAWSVFAADIDGDGDNDVISVSKIDDKVVWYENKGAGLFGLQQVISIYADAPHSVYATDLDGDGDTDVLSASLHDSKVAWYENLGGGTFALQQVLAVTGEPATTVFARDLDGDGDKDVLFGTSAGAFGSGGQVSWCRNLGAGVFGPAQVISTAADSVVSVYATDLDGDGDADVLSASSSDNKIAWYENLGAGLFGPQQVISLSTFGATSVFAADLDGDGDPDVMSASIHDDKVAWFENLMIFDCNGNGVGDGIDISSGFSADCNANGVPDECDLTSGFSVDIDGDGQLDDCVAPPLMANLYELSVSAGGTQNFTLTASIPMDFYLLLGTTSGTSPGTPSGGFIVPLNVDSYLLHTALSPNLAPMSGSFGTLTPSGTSGTATASFTLPPAFSPSLVGLTLHHAYVTIDTVSGNLSFVSNPVPLTLLP